MKREKKAAEFTIPGADEEFDKDEATTEAPPPGKARSRRKLPRESGPAAQQIMAEILHEEAPEEDPEPPLTLVEARRRNPGKSTDEICPDVARMEAEPASKPQAKVKKPPRWLSELFAEYPPIIREGIIIGDSCPLPDNRDSCKIKFSDLYTHMREKDVDRARIVSGWCTHQLKQHGSHYMGRRYVADERLLWRHVLNTAFYTPRPQMGPFTATMIADAWEAAFARICAGDRAFLQSIEKRPEAIKTYEKGVIQIAEIRRLAAADPGALIPRRKAADLLGVSVSTVKLYELPQKTKKRGTTINLEAITGPNGRVSYTAKNLLQYAEWKYSGK